MRQRQPLRPPAVVVEEAIRHKFQSRSWVYSPLRKMETALKMFTIDTWAVDQDDQRKHRVSCVTSSDIREMIYARDKRAMSDPYAAWDYVTCTLSRGEMLRIADWLDGKRNGGSEVKAFKSGGGIISA